MLPTITTFPPCNRRPTRDLSDTLATRHRFKLRPWHQLVPRPAADSDTDYSRIRDSRRRLSVDGDAHERGDGFRIRRWGGGRPLASPRAGGLDEEFQNVTMHVFMWCNLASEYPFWLGVKEIHKHKKMNTWRELSVYGFQNLLLAHDTLRKKKEKWTSSRNLLHLTSWKFNRNSMVVINIQ